MTPRGRFNPFPGLRPFEPDEDHLFFGREREIDALVRRLRTTRFLSVVGASGSGKSSLVRSGLIPALHSGLMVSAGSGWRVALFRPGDDPTGNLARALAEPDALGDIGELGATTPVILDAALRRSSLGLVGAVRQSGLDTADNLLVVVDQFEELFRFRRSGTTASRDESIAFVKLLVEAARDEQSRIFVVITMRSDFIGDCMEYPGLAEAVSAGQYLVPRMSRDELRLAIEGPVAVGGGRIASRLVLRMLNDVGDDPDQLPVLQHALMRTWDHWAGRDGGPEIDLEDYEAVGTLRHALSRHAEEAYAECAGSAPLVEHVFKALTDTFSDRRGIRRPTTIGELAAICDAPESDVIALVEVFRSAGRSFLMPPATTPLSSQTVVDIAHESLMRCWTRLMAWADEERASATFYARLSQATTWFEEGTAGLWRNPELALGVRWRAENEPTAAWAARYNTLFERAMAFLDRSADAQREEEAARERARLAQLRLARWAAAVFGVLAIAALGAMWMAWRESAHAEANFRLARNAVDQTLASAEVDPARMGVDTPQMEEFRRSLLERTKAYYARFIEQRPSREELYREDAYARYRLGHIDRMLGLSDEAAGEYRDSIDEFERLLKAHPDRVDYRSALADAYNYLGETYRPHPSHAADAAAAYDRALSIATALVHDYPEEGSYRRQLARTHYNRGILRSMTATLGDASFKGSEEDFREAVRLLEPVMQKDTDRTIPQELARALNNLASLISQDDRRVPEARPLYERAVQLDRDVLQAEPDNRQVALELSKFENNLAELLRMLGDTDAAAARNREALALLERLARPAPSLGVELADARTLRGRILGRQDPAQALDEYARAYDAFTRLIGTPDVRPPAEFHLRYGDLLLNLAALSHNAPDVAAGALLSKALATYLDLTESSEAAGNTSEIQAEVDTLAYVLPALPAPVRQSADARLQALRRSLRANK